MNKSDLQYDSNTQFDKNLSFTVEHDQSLRKKLNVEPNHKKQSVPWFYYSQSVLLSICVTMVLL